MALADDFTIDYGAKTVSHTSGTTVYTVLAFFQWLATTFAAQAQMDDAYAFVSDTPTVYRWVNGWAFGTPSSDYKFLKTGSIESSNENELWSNLYSIGSQEAGTQIYLIQNDAEVTPWWGTGNIDILVLVKTGGTWIQSPDTGGTPTDGGLWVFSREHGDLYDHGFVDLSGGGSNPVGINTAADINNTTISGTVAGWTDISITFGDVNKDLNNGNGLQPYKVTIDGAGRSMIQIYEYLKYTAVAGSTYDLNGDDGQEYRSALEGTYTDVKVAPFGTFAGTTFYGARGVWVENTLTADYSFKDANNVIQDPPSYQKVYTNHATLSGCQVFVAEIYGGTVIKDQYTIDSADSNSITATGTVDINRAPQSGVLRVADTAYNYTSFSGSVFQGVTPDPNAETGDFYVPLLDLLADATSEQSDNLIYSINIDVRTVVRKYGLKPYTADTTFGSTGLSFSPILTADPQAT